MSVRARHAVRRSTASKPRPSPRVVIVNARLSDAPVIARFNAALALETEGRRLDPARLLRGVRNLLRDRSKGFYLLAKVRGRVAGQLMITFEWSDWRNGNFWWIQSVYVSAEFRRLGVFKNLFDEVQRRASASGKVCGLRLYVERANRRAQKAYTGLGLRKAHYEMFERDFVLG